MLSRFTPPHRSQPNDINPLRSSSNRCTRAGLEKREGGVMDYSQLSDFEINAMVHFGDKPQFKIENGYASFLNGDGVKTGFGQFYYKNNFPDYCSSAADAWPIISDNKINMEWHEWKGGDFRPYALNSATMKSAYDSNPLRAAMIVFLMMQEQGNA